MDNQTSAAVALTVGASTYVMSGEEVVALALLLLVLGVLIGKFGKIPSLKRDSIDTVSEPKKGLDVPL